MRGLVRPRDNGYRFAQYRFGPVNGSQIAKAISSSTADHITSDIPRPD
jgi:hypothetical protein